jgi:hypothetical protein
MDRSTNFGRTLLLGIATGFGLIAVTGGVVALVAPRNIPHVPEMVLSLFLLACAYAGIGVCGAGYVEEARGRGRRIPIWLALGTESTIMIPILLAALAGSLFIFLPAVVLRLLLVAAVVVPSVIAAGVLLVNSLVKQAHAETLCSASGQTLIERAAELLEGAAAQAPPDLLAAVRTLLERHRRSIAPMAHRATPLDDDLGEAMHEVVRLISPSEGKGSDPDAGSLASIREAIERVERLQETRIREQVCHG